MKLSVCIDAVMSGISPEEALMRLKCIGVEAFEFWGWWDKDMDALYSAVKSTGLVPAAMCTRMVSLTDPARRKAYLLGLRESVAAAQKIGCKTLISQTGDDTGAGQGLPAIKAWLTAACGCAHFGSGWGYARCGAAQYICRP